MTHSQYQWQQIRLTTTQIHSEVVADLLQDLGAVAVTFQDAGQQPIYEPQLGTTPYWINVEVIGLFPITVALEPVCEQLQTQLAPNVILDLRTQALPEQDWTRVWLKDFKPLCFGKHLWICPSPSLNAEQPLHLPEDAITVILDPGLAFGTGTHPTTGLMLSWIANADLNGKTIIDYGCGSGILSIACKKCGAQTVIGVDHDPQALTASRDNAERNQLKADDLNVYLPEDLPDIQADVVLANILAQPLITLAPTIMALVKPGGKLILSGILHEQANRVIKVYQPKFSFAPPVVDQEWVRLDGTCSG